MKTPYNKYLYLSFMALGLFQFFYLKNYLEAAASFGIGMAFDPFDTEQKWNDRPSWQKGVLIVTLLITFTSLILGFLKY